MDDDNDPPPKKRYRVYMQTRASILTQYDGHVDVWCASDDGADLFAAAVRELRRTAFPDRFADSWRMTGFAPL